MTTDPNVLIAKLRGIAAQVFTHHTIEVADLRHLLALLDHQEAQLSALRAMAAAGKPLPSPVAVPAESICAEADRIVSFDRQAQYGHPKEDFGRTAAMWEPIFGLPPGAISPDKVPMALICVKLSRLCHGYKRDSAVDVAGYAKTISMIHEAG